MDNKKNSQNGHNKKLWGGRFAKSQSPVTERLSASIDYDKRLYEQDIRGSIAHARMLQRIGVLSESELDKIINGLEDIGSEISEGTFVFQKSREDIHMNIEAALTERIGEPGKKLHTARSRNDQVALDVRLYIKERSAFIKKGIESLVNVILDLAEKHIDVVMPGYTHLQVAQPVRFSHHMCAYAWKLLRDRRRLDAAVGAADMLPLGSGALAGLNYPSDREFLRDDLGFKGIVPNSMDAVSDRDFVLDFLYFCSVLGIHLSRMCEELVLWSTPEFSFIRLSDAVTTGSSIMPQKRNPDLAELIRGKSGRLVGNLFGLLTVLKGLPMTYNRDLQEDKEGLFDSMDTVELVLEGMIEMLSDIQIRDDRMRDAVYNNFSTATDLADYLVQKGVPFRESHEIVGTVVRYCEENKKDFFSLDERELKTFCDLIDEDVIAVLDPVSSTERKLSPGSTSKIEVEKQLTAIREELSL